MHRLPLSKMDLSEGENDTKAFYIVFISQLLSLEMENGPGNWWLLCYYFTVFFFLEVLCLFLRT